MASSPWITEFGQFFKSWLALASELRPLRLRVVVHILGSRHPFHSFDFPLPSVMLEIVYNDNTQLCIWRPAHYQTPYRLRNAPWVLFQCSVSAPIDVSHLNIPEHHTLYCRLHQFATTLSHSSPLLDQPHCIRIERLQRLPQLHSSPKT